MTSDHSAFRIPKSQGSASRRAEPQASATAPATRSSRRHAQGLTTALGDIGHVYRSRGNVHDARGATSSKRNSYSVVSGSTAPATTAPEAREPPQRPVRLETVSSTRNPVYRPRGDTRDIPGATSSQAVWIQQPQTAQRQQQPRQCGAHLNNSVRP